MILINKYPVWIAGLIAVSLAAGSIVFEFYHSPPERNTESFNYLIETSLSEAEQIFNHLSEDLEQTSGIIADLITRAQAADHDQMAIHNRLNQANIWGITVYKNDEKWLWKDFVIDPPPTQQTETPTAFIRNLNNVVLLVYVQHLELDDDHYLILTSARLSQITDLSFISNANFDLSHQITSKGFYPVHFHFVETIPDHGFYRPLYTSHADSVGAVWATFEDAEIYRHSRIVTLNKWRFILQLSALFAFFFFLLVLSNFHQNILVHIIQILLLFAIWFALLYSGILEFWISLVLSESAEITLIELQETAAYIIHAIILFILFVNIHNVLRISQHPSRNEHHFRTFAYSVLYGALNVLLLLFFTETTFRLLTESSVQLLDLELTPDVHSFIFYIFSGLFFTATAGILITTGYHLYKSEEEKSVLIAVASLFSFIVVYFFIDLATITAHMLNWIFVLNFFLLILFLFITHLLYRYPGNVLSMSGFRKLMIIILIASTSIYVIIWNTNQTRQDQELVDEANVFLEEKEARTRDILFELLSDTEQDFLQYTLLNPETQVQRIRSQFQRTVQNIIQPDWKNYSFHLQLLTPDGEELTNYSTTLDTPAWTSYYNIATMSSAYRGEQIRWQTNRPVIWGRPANLSDKYTGFDRGWIPIYNRFDETEIVLWIAGDVYRERPDYNKPLRAVLSATTASDWKKSYYISEYADERVTRTTVKGIYRNQPQYNKLPEREAEIAQRDSSRFITNITPQGNFREVLLHSDDKIIKASTPIPGFNHHLFSYFRMQIVLIFFGLFCFSILAMSGRSQFSLFGQNRKFRDRLIDGLSLATILFLTVLIFATQYAVTTQNEKNVERDLIQTLNGISEALKGADIFSDDFDSSELLAEFTTPVNADFILYRGASVDQSTTPQIFRQYLLPSTLSYPAFDYLYNRERTHYFTTNIIGNDEMLIGYRSIADAMGMPAGVIAIPTFLHSPVYNDQLLETTSYLFVVYLFIFTLFIAGSVFLSNQLTKPLKIIQTGLNKISRGDMKTKVAVTSRDEIGSLANAYNNMVQRLDHAQRELMKAERESAWKEMAQQVAHEIKNPLTPMKLNLQHLQRRLETEPENILELKPIIEKTTSNIIEQIESLNKIASDFSKFAKPISEPKKDVNLSALIRSIAELYEHEESADLTLSIPKKDVVLQLVEDEFRRALINLIKNSLEASVNGTIRVQIKLKKRRNYVELAIKDNGIGINEDDRDKIFLPKFSTKSSGTGLGLAITKKIIEAHEGEIRFESNEGQGTSFYITLPLQ